MVIYQMQFAGQFQIFHKSKRKIIPCKCIVLSELYQSPAICWRNHKIYLVQPNCCYAWFHCNDEKTLIISWQESIPLEVREPILSKVLHYCNNFGLFNFKVVSLMAWSYEQSKPGSLNYMKLNWAWKANQMWMNQAAIFTSNLGPSHWCCDVFLKWG